MVGPITRCSVVGMVLLAMLQPLPTFAQSTKSVQFMELQFSVPVACVFSTGRDGDVDKATCNWTDGTRWMIGALSHTSTTALPSMSDDQRQSFVRNLCHMLAEHELHNVPSGCRLSNIRLTDVSKKDLPEGAEACELGTATLDLEYGGRLLRRLIVCHVRYPASRSTAVLLVVTGDAPKAMFDRVSKQIIASVSIRP